MSTVTAPIAPLRDDVVALMRKHLADVDTSSLTDPQKYGFYRAYRADLHDLCGCGSDPDKRDHGLFIAAIREFCGRIGL